ncbi:hypothetical protein MKX01_035276 [Papaver californicum]|nr:hypothetical protein MKX01_035276 [Papaver californicum]
MVKTRSTTESTNHTVFIYTYLKARFALIITNNNIVFHLKQKIMSEHLHCFSMHGNIDVNAFKVERKQFYHLSDSILVGEKRKKKKKSTSIREEINPTNTPSQEIDLKRKLSEASIDTKAKGVASKRKKNKNLTKVSDGETGLSSSGAGKDDSTRDVVPVRSKREKTLDANHPNLETKKAGKSLLPIGKSRKSKLYS